MSLQTPKESRVLAVERKLARVDDLLRDIRRELIDVWQHLWDDDTVHRSPAATCTASYSGHLLDCTGAGLVGKTITVKSAGGSTLGTATTGAGGAFSGTVTITSPSQAVDFTTSGISGYHDLAAMKTLMCGSNAVGNLSPTAIVPSAPTLNSLSNLTYCGNAGTVTVNLSGIADGNSGACLPITITATSSGTASIPNPTVTYTSPNTTGSIQFTPAAGVCLGPIIISVKVASGCSTACGGTNSVVRTFSVTQIQPSTPSLNPIPDPGPFLAGSINQTVAISGISRGACQIGTGAITVTASSNNPGVSDVVSVGYTSPFATGSIIISIGTAGTATITVTVTDTSANHCGTNTFQRTFNVVVV